MDAYEATKIVFERIQNLDPQNAAKIMGFLLIQDHGEKEMIRLAFGSESSVQTVIMRIKQELNLASPNTPLVPSINTPSANPRQSFSSSGLNLNLNLDLNRSSNSVRSWANTSGNFSDLQILDDLISPTAFNSSCNFSDFQTLDDSIGPCNSGSRPSAAVHGGASTFYANGEMDLIDELLIQEQLSFLEDGNRQIGGNASEFFYRRRLQDKASSPSGFDAGCFAGSGTGHRRSCSVSDDDLRLGFGWKPCLFYARGYCKNGTACRFLHGGGGGEISGGDGAATNSPKCSPIAAYKSMNFLQQVQSESPRSLVMDGMHKNNPGCRQIYLTFPADSTFKEEDVSNYFSNFGPVQDVRIPYQQKRMFGFVTFDFAETVKLILAKGNPHFICDARVLVKPYKEKGKIPDKHRKQQQPMESGEFTGCGSPTGMAARDPYDLQLGARMFYNTREMLLRRKLEDEADLQQAIALQNRRLMNLRLIDVKRNNHHRTLSTGAVISSPTYSPTFFNQNVFTPSAHGNPEANEENGSIVKDESLSNDKENSNGKEYVMQECDLNKRSEHNLPDSPFASPKAVGGYATTPFTGFEVEKHVASTPSTENNLTTDPPLFVTSSHEVCFRP